MNDRCSSADDRILHPRQPLTLVLMTCKPNPKAHNTDTATAKRVKVNQYLLVSTIIHVGSTDTLVVGVETERMAGYTALHEHQQQ